MDVVDATVYGTHAAADILVIAGSWSRRSVAGVPLGWPPYCCGHPCCCSHPCYCSRPCCCLRLCCNHVVSAAAVDPPVAKVLHVVGPLSGVPAVADVFVVAGSPSVSGVYVPAAAGELATSLVPALVGLSFISGLPAFGEVPSILALYCRWHSCFRCYGCSCPHPCCCWNPRCYWHPSCSSRCCFC